MSTILKITPITVSLTNADPVGRASGDPASEGVDGELIPYDYNAIWDCVAIAILVLVFLSP